MANESQRSYKKLQLLYDKSDEHNQHVTARVGVARRLGSCECDDSMFPGTLFPCAVDDDDTRAWVQACDLCDTFATDDHAAFFVGRVLEKPVGFARFDENYSPRPYIKCLTFKQAEKLNRRKKR